MTIQGGLDFIGPITEGRVLINFAVSAYTPKADIGLDITLHLERAGKVVSSFGSDLLTIQIGIRLILSLLRIRPKTLITSFSGPSGRPARCHKTYRTLT